MSAAHTIASLGSQAPGAMSLDGFQYGRAPGKGVKAEPQFSSYAAGPVVEGAKLFVGQLPFSRNEHEISKVFSKHGPVAEVFLHKDAQGQKKGGAFVRYFSADHAMAALELDGFLFDGATRPITVSLAGTDGKRQRTA